MASASPRGAHLNFECELEARSPRFVYQDLELPLFELLTLSTLVDHADGKGNSIFHLVRHMVCLLLPTPPL